MQTINLTKANVQDGIRLIKEDSEGFSKDSSIEEIGNTRMIAVTKVKMRSSGEVRDVLNFGTVDDMMNYPATPIVVFNVKTYWGLVDKMGTESVAKLTNEFYRQVQDKVSE